MTKRIASSASSSTRWQRSNDVWSLIRDGQCLAVIEPSWDGRHWSLFEFDDDGEPFFVCARRRITGLRLCLLLWAGRTNDSLKLEEAPL